MRQFLNDLTHDFESVKKLFDFVSMSDVPYG